MNVKFTECVFVHMELDTFCEYIDVEDFINNNGKEDLYNYVGYFPVGSNTTYKEFKDIKEEQTWTVAYHDKDDYMRIVFFNTTLEIKRKLRNIIKDSRGLE